MNALESYRESFQKYGNRPEGVQWSKEGQNWRFARLCQLVRSEYPTRFAEVLDVGCGLGNLSEYLLDTRYHGIDIVPELIEQARKNYPSARFSVYDALHNWPENYDFVFMSGIFNAPKMQKSGEFLFSVLENAFSHARKAILFNFTSCHTNFTDPDANYFNPGIVFEYCQANLSPKIAMHHHYRNCDVSVMVCR